MSSEQVVGRSKDAVVRQCTTHHYACDCRERKLRVILQSICADLMESSNNVAFKAYIDINEFWFEQYGCAIMDAVEPHLSNPSFQGTARAPYPAKRCSNS